LDAVRMARHKMFFDARKAVRELGLPQTPARQALADAVRWFQENGYVKRRSPHPTPPPQGGRENRAVVE
ncbi:MAG: hypothetical protein NTX64_16080, partial [Elusimicrobia bacterium]|nr:hypothetical protein [Elusimicrobiota bacterium]